MYYKISCSFGEVIDKLTVLKLKLQNSNLESHSKNILSEINTLHQECPSSKNNDKLFNFLYKINNQIWDLKDHIRNKIRLQQFDREYIKYTVDFQRINDLRVQIKSKINLKYSSTIIEEDGNNTIGDDLQLLELIKYEYGIGNYVYANNKIQDLIDKYTHTNIKNQFIADLYISYHNICNILNINNPHSHKLDEITDNPEKYNMGAEFINFSYQIQCGNLLLKKKYLNANKYVNYYNNISNLGTTMTFFKDGDTDKTLFIYYMGGIGDIIMLGRIVRELCNTYKQNKIKYLIDFKNLSWIFDSILSDIPNLTILYASNKNIVGHFDYHCNLMKVYNHLNYKTYESIPFLPYLNNINTKSSAKHLRLINKLTASGKKSYIFNWHGNSNNPHEKNNRKMELKNAIPLFKQSDINWIITSKDLTNADQNILKDFGNIFILKNEIENYDTEQAFYDTIVIFKYIEGVISTDTSLVHLSLSMDVPTYVLLTIGSEWRWCRNCDRTNWYPKANLIRQKKVKNWDNVISELCNILH